MFASIAILLVAICFVTSFKLNPLKWLPLQSSTKLKVNNNQGLSFVHKVVTKKMNKNAINEEPIFRVYKAPRGIYTGWIIDSTKKKQLNGTMEYQWRDGFIHAVYTGEWKDNNRHGNGTIRHMKQNDTYVGEWLNDKRHGKGLHITTDQVYEGDFRYDYKTGYGKLWDAYDGSTYEGTFKIDIKTGNNCVQTWPDGSKYVGDYWWDQRHGNGTMTYANGNVYVGPWLCDMQGGGNGTMTYGPNEIYNRSEGLFSIYQLPEVGTIEFKNGDVYVGETNRGRINGTGTMTYANGSVYSGWWARNEPFCPGRKIYEDYMKTQFSYKQHLRRNLVWR